MVDQAIFNWFLNMRSQNVPLSASMIQEKAVIFAKELNTENFQDSDDWLRRWNQRKNISLKTVSRESKSVTPEMVNAWSETSLSTLTGMAAANAMGDKLSICWSLGRPRIHDAS